MRSLTITLFVLAFMITGFGQEQSLLIADGTSAVPKKYDLQPTVESLPSAERDAVLRTAFTKAINIKEKGTVQPSTDKTFQVLDVAEGFFISREFEDRAYLYTAYSPKMKCHYQGLLILGVSNNKTTFTPKAHYVYAWRGDKYIRLLSDINSNVLSEIAIFSEQVTDREVRRTVRIVELSPNGLQKIGQKEIYTSLAQKQRTPKTLDRSDPAKRVYSPPIVTALKLSVIKVLGKPVLFSMEEWVIKNDNWTRTAEVSPKTNVLEADQTDYVEAIRPIFPKGFEKK